MSTMTSRHPQSPDISTASSDATTIRSFDDMSQYVNMEPDLIFGDMDDVVYTHEQSAVPFPWSPLDQEIKSTYSFDTPSFASYDYGPSPSSPTESYYDSGGSFYSPGGSNSSPAFDNNLYLPTWGNDIEPSPTGSAPIPIRSPMEPRTVPFISFSDHSSPLAEAAFSPSAFAALHPLPASVSPPSSFDDSYFNHPRMTAGSQIESAVPIPSWTANLWDAPSPPSVPAQSPSPPLTITSHFNDATARPRYNSGRRGSLSSGLFLSSSAPSYTPTLGSSRPYSRRSESISVSEDRDATVRRRRKISAPDDVDVPVEKLTDPNAPTKSVLRPPKLAPSAWQLYFTDWIQRQQASSTRKLNVAQAAKEAGQEYASLTPDEKEPYKQRSQAMKEAREREHASYMKSLTPDDIKRENTFRAAQRKAGKSRKSNIKDPNAPKKPLSAYFMFLQRIRANPRMVLEVFGDETETTKQSVLAAAKWRSMSDDEKKPFLAQAEQEKMEYEAARRIYEEGSSSSSNTYGGSSFNFSILPGSPLFSSMKVESESEGEGGGYRR